MSDVRSLRRPATPSRRWLSAASAAALPPIVAVAVWQAASQAGWLTERILPAPSSVAAATAALARSGELWEAAGASALRALIGLLLGGAAGLILGALNAIARRAGAQADRLLQALGLVPVLAFAPLILLWLGAGETARLALLALGAFFPIYRRTVRGVREVDAGLVAIGQSCGLQGWPLCVHVILPGALPSMLAGLKRAVGLVWLILVALELFAAPSGLGRLALAENGVARPEVLLGVITLYAAMSAVSRALVLALERRLLRWSPAHRPELFSRTD
ncbi:ABC transporter permease subunit [Achromobacter sp.]|uniref:ABC transporter permease subunit n=1 Tax=Achromobacter sp. TaxID=134375 RepID=UPI0028AD162A|nr:ABC transporter permease subunit [Achromobacter sp.]